MPETTNDKLLNATRYRQNKEQTMTVQSDEDLLEEIADFMMATAEQFQSENLSNVIRDVANGLITNKSALAKGGAVEEEEVPPEGMGGPPLPPPGMGAQMGGPPAPPGY